MNVKTQLIILALLNIIPLELAYGHYIADLILSKLFAPELVVVLLEMLYRDYTTILCTELLIILFSLLVPKSAYISKVLFNQCDRTNLPEQTPLTQEKATPKPATDWLSSLLDLLVPLSILFSFLLVTVIYCGIIVGYIYQPPCYDIVKPFLNTLPYHILLLSYIRLLVTACDNTLKQCKHLVKLFLSCYFCWDYIIQPALSYIKCNFFTC